MSQLSDQQRAERCAQIMWENDKASADLGMTLLSVTLPLALNKTLNKTLTGYKLNAVMS